MKSILINIKPKWCAKIMNGDKTVEIRKSKALATAIQKLIDKNGYAELYVYCTKGKPRIVDLRDDAFYLGCSPRLNGKVIFKFRCYKVEEMTPFEEYKSPFGMAYKLTSDKVACCFKAHLTYDEYNHYLKGKKGYAIHINDLVIFDKPKELSEFHKIGFHEWCAEHPPILSLLEPKKCYEELKQFMITKAPQNFCYVEVE